MPKSLQGPQWPSGFYTYVLKWPCDFEEFKADDPYYVGVGTGNRYTHQRCFESIHIDKELKKLGFVPIVELFLAESKQDAEKKETEFVLKFGRRDLGTGFLFNKSNGQGTYGRRQIHSEKTKALMSAKNKRPRTPEQIAKWRSSYVGHKHSEETKRKIGLASLGRKRKKPCPLLDDAIRINSDSSIHDNIHNISCSDPILRMGSET